MYGSVGGGSTSTGLSTRWMLPEGDKHFCPMVLVFGWGIYLGAKKRVGPWEASSAKFCSLCQAEKLGLCPFLV